MSDFFDKISTLINAQVNDLLGQTPRSPLARVKLNADEAEKDPRRSARLMRRRLEEAIEYEDELQARIDERLRAVVELDKLVDDMLRSGDERSAERLQGQLNMKRQQLTIAESEMRDHRLMTQHLLQELGALEMALDSQAKRERASNDPSAGRTRIPIEGVDASEKAGNIKESFLGAVSDKLDEARTNFESLLDSSPPPAAKPTRPSAPQRFEIIDEEPDPRKPKPRKKDEPDMSARLSRLSKPSTDD